MNNNTIGLKLNQSSVSAESKAKIAGVAEVLKNFNTFAENSNVNFNSASGVSILCKKQEAFADVMAGALTTRFSEATNAMARGDIKNRVFAEARANMLDGDIKYFKEAFESQTKIFAESMLAGTYKPFQLAMIPYVYLETIAANSRFIMPTKQYASEQLPPRKAKTKLLIIDGKEYKFPNCLKDNEVMKKLRNVGSKEEDVTINLATQSKVNIFDIMNGYSKEKDKLIPQIDLIAVTYDTTDASAPATGVKVTLNTSALLPDANNYTMGRIAKTDIQIKDKKDDTETIDAMVSGVVDFSNGNVKLQADSQIKTITLKVRVAGDGFRNTASVGINTTPIIQMIKHRSNFTFSYDPGALEQYMQLEKIDGVLEGQSIIFDAAIATKDAYAFDVLRETRANLIKWQAEMPNFAETNNFYAERAHYDEPATNAPFRPVSEEQWITDSMGKRMKEIHTNVYHKFNSKNGVTLNWYGSPDTVARFVKGTPIISKGENYGGYCTDFAVFSVQVAQSVAKVVESERVSNEEGLVCIPYSNSEEQPTFEFQQGIHALYTDNTIREASHPHLPAIAYYDYYDCQYIFAIMGAITMNEKAPNLEA